MPKRRNTIHRINFRRIAQRRIVRRTATAQRRQGLQSLIKCQDRISSMAMVNPGKLVHQIHRPVQVNMIVEPLHNFVGKEV